MVCMTCKMKASRNYEKVFSAEKDLGSLADLSRRGTIPDW